jgi:hypothetical protein
MTAEPKSFDPYRSPSLPEGPYAGVPRVGRPGKLTTLCVLCIVLGALGMMNSLFGAVGAAGGRVLQAAIQPKTSPGMPPGMQEAQNKFQEDLYTVQVKYLWAIVPGLIFRFVAALLLLIGGIRSLSLREPGRKLLLIACSVALVFELCNSILQSVISLDTMTAVNSYVESLMAALPQNGPAEVGAIVPAIVRGSIVGGMVITYLIALAKMGLYLFGLIYLQKKHIRGLFTSGPQPRLVPGS